MRLSLGLRRRGDEGLVGLDIQPGFVAAVQARVNGSIVAERAGALELPADSVRDGEVIDEQAVGETLHELFARGGLQRRVRVGVANQRTVLRTLEVPPVTDRKELAAAVNFQAQDQVPMPLSNAVMDFHPLGVVDTPAGPRQRVVLVAAQRDMIERLIAAVRSAGLSPEAIDLSAFALIRSLYRPEPESTSRVLYLNIDGLTNLAIAEGTVCRFTRVVGSGLEGMAGELAERRSIALSEARALLAAVDLRAAAAHDAAADAAAGHDPHPRPDEPAPGEPAASEPHEAAGAAEAGAAGEAPQGRAAEGPPVPPQEATEAPGEPARSLSAEEAEASELAMSYEELTDVAGLAPAQEAASDTELARVLENGIRDIAGEVRNSLDFHRSQEGGGEVSHVVMSGSAQDIPGFAQALQDALGVEVRCPEVSIENAVLAEAVSPHRLAVATGLATAEAPQ